MKRLVLLLFTLVPPLFGNPLAVYLTWEDNPSTTITVQWITKNSDPEDTLFVRPIDENQERAIIGSHTPLPQGIPFFVHRVHRHNLSPKRTYSFRIADREKEYRFQTLPSNLQEPISFVVGGDIYHDTLDLVEIMNQVAASKSPSFAVLGGDLAYAAPKYTFFSQNSRRWLEWLASYSKTMVTPEGQMIPIVPLIGNHDVSGRYDQTPEQAPFFYTLFFPNNNAYHTLDIGKDFSLIALDSGHTHPIEGEQKQWLEKVLQERENFLHLFVAYHVPAYPSVRPFLNKRCTHVRKTWVPLFEQYGVHWAFEHHDHAYKRTHPLLQGKPSPNGIVYFGDGAWGVQQPRRPFSPKKRPYLNTSAQKRHFLLVTVGQKERSIQAMDPSGNAFDTFFQSIYQTTHEAVATN